jgi:nitroreductase
MIEQKLSTGASAQNILLSLHALGYSAIWRTGKFAFNPFISSKLGLNDNQEILGYVYVGTSDGENKKIPSLEIDSFVKKL